MTIDIDDDLVRQAQVVTKEADASVALVRAVEEYVHRTTVEGLKELAGKVEFDEEWLAQRERQHPRIRRDDDQRDT